MVVLAGFVQYPSIYPSMHLKVNEPESITESIFNEPESITESIFNEPESIFPSWRNSS